MIHASVPLSGRRANHFWQPAGLRISHISASCYRRRCRWRQGVEVVSQELFGWLQRESWVPQNATPVREADDARHQ